MTEPGRLLNSLERDLLKRRSRLFLGIVVGAVGTLLTAPLLLLLVSAIFPLGSWERLSEIGQSFTGISAVLSAVALGAVSYTSRLQARQATVQAIQAARAAQLELVKTAMDDPTLAQVLGRKIDDSHDIERWRLATYRNLWFMYLQMTFRTEELSIDGLRRSLSLELVTSWEAIGYWRNGRQAFAAELTDLRGKLFIEIVDDEVMRAAARLTATPRPMEGSSGATRQTDGRYGASGPRAEAPCSADSNSAGEGEDVTPTNE